MVAISPRTRSGRRRRWTAVLVAAALLLGLAPEVAAGADASTEAGFAVTNGNDSGAGSYRQAVANAGADPGADVITFNAGLTATLSSDVSYTGTTDLTIHGNGSTVDGNGHQILRAASPTSLTIDGITLRNGTADAGEGGAVYAGSGDIAVTDSTLTDNTAENTGGTAANGGALYAEDGAITVTDSTLTGNTATATGYGAFGGAIVGDGVTIADSTLTGNEAQSGNGGSSLVAFGGAVYSYSGPVDITDSTLTNNTATGDVARGGAVATHTATIHLERSTLSSNTVDGSVSNIVRAKGGGGASVASGSIVVTDSTLNGNESTGGPGGALAAKYAITLVRSTLAGNTVLDYYGSGGGAYSSDGLITATNSTITQNTATGSAGTYSYGGGLRTDFGDLRLRHVTLASNSATYSANVSGWGSSSSTFASVFADPLGGGLNCGSRSPISSYNYATDTSCLLSGTGDVQNGADPLLLALGDFGGPTRTRSPKSASALVDALPGTACDATITTDQRGAPRPFPAGGPCDIGAVEVGASRPDARIKKGATGALVGNDVYNTSGTGQTRSGSASRGGTVTYYVSVQNDADHPEQIRLKGTASTTRFTVRYRDPANANITGTLTAGTYLTPALAPGATFTITVTVLTSAPAGATLTGNVKATSTVDSSVKDKVVFVTRRS